MTSQDPQKLQTVWNVPPVIRWEHNNNYGMNALISGIVTDHGITANIDPKADRKTGTVTYTATVKMHQFERPPSIILPHRMTHEFTEMGEAKWWCAEWITY